MNKRQDGQNIKVDPQYQWDERLGIDVECDIPDPKLFMPLGYDRKPKEGGKRSPDDIKKHYRRYYTQELENNEEVMGEPVF